VVSHRQPRPWLRWLLLGAAVLLALGILDQFWKWEVSRVEVLPGKYLVQISRWGKNLPEGEILAPDGSYKGIMLEPLPEGRHFLNPIFWEYRVENLIQVLPGQSLVLTRLYGKPISAERLAKGEVLAEVPFPVPEDQRGKEDRGIVRDVLMPGSYRINPFAYSVEHVPAVEVKVDQVGVRTLKVGLDPATLPRDAERSRYVVPPGYRGVQQAPVPPGTYYVNKYRETITPVEVRSHRVELEDIEFPSRDGFILKPHVLVEYAVVPDLASEILVRITDEGILHQEDRSPEEQQRNEILQKVILPHIRGYARIEGSNFDARDFIVTSSGAVGDVDRKAMNNREALQKALEAKVKPRCRELGIDVRSVSLTTLVPPDELAQQIREREIALVDLAKNKVRVGQYKAEQGLKAKEALKQQANDKVEGERRLTIAKTKVNQLMEVEELRLKQDLLNAQLRLDAAKLQAQAVLAKGKAEAAVIHLENEAEVAGLRTAVQGFGSIQHFAQFHVLRRLGPALGEIFASDDSEFARLISTYLSPPANMPNGKAPLASGPEGAAAGNGAAPQR
jgi:hypothetical protein